MGYHLDDEALGLDYVARRIEGDDLIPSQEPLLEGLHVRLKALENAGIGSLAGLRLALRKPASLSALAAGTKVEEGYLVLLRRAVEGWFPKPPKLSEMPGADPAVVSALGRAGIADARNLLEAAAAKSSRTALRKRAGVRAEALDELVGLADLTRIQWVAPGFARLLFDAGFRNAASVAAAQGDLLYDAVRVLNSGKKYYHGTLGKRDMARLVRLAREIPVELEP